MAIGDGRKPLRQSNRRLAKRHAKRKTAALAALAVAALVFTQAWAFTLKKLEGWRNQTDLERRDPANPPFQFLAAH
jgi:hypothetical protein